VWGGGEGLRLVTSGPMGVVMVTAELIRGLVQVVPIIVALLLLWLSLRKEIRERRSEAHEREIAALERERDLARSQVEHIRLVLDPDYQAAVEARIRDLKVYIEQIEEERDIGQAELQEAAVEIEALNSALQRAREASEQAALTDEQRDRLWGYSLSLAAERELVVERSDNPATLAKAIQRLKDSGKRQKVLQVPQHHMDAAAEAARKAKVNLTVKNMKGNKSRSVRGK